MSTEPWASEPDRVEWTTEAGLLARIGRTEMGHLCGYVQVPPGHPLHGVDYSEKSPALEKALERRKGQPMLIRLTHRNPVLG